MSGIWLFWSGSTLCILIGGPRFVDESMFSLIDVVTDCSLLLLLVSGLSRFVVGGGFWKTARFDAVSLFRLEV